MRTAKDIIADLPYQCYSILNTTGELIKLKAGEKGYYRIGQEYPKDVARLKGISLSELADKWNAEDKVTKGVRLAMEAGSMWGWDVPLADPLNYTQEGIFIKE